MPRSKSKKTSGRKYTKQLMSIGQCQTKTLKQIRKTKAYKDLIPYGVGKRRSGNPKNKYHYGYKSTMRKAELCEALSEPKNYHNILKRNASKKKNSGPRKRYSRTGDCRPFSGPNKRTPPCNKKFKHSGLTTTAAKCCYKKKQSVATKAKRRANAAKTKTAKRNYNKKKSITQKSVGRRKKSSKRKR